MSSNITTWMRTTAALTALTGFILGLLLSTHALLSNFKNIHEQYADTLFSEIESTVIETASIINALNKLNYTQCLPENLLEMRRALFLAQHIRDIGFLNNDNKIICTTGLGVLDTPFSSFSSDFFTENGFEIWVNLPLKMFDQEYSALIAKKGYYNTVYDLSRINKIITNDYNWQLIYHFAGETNHIAGSKDTFRFEFKESGYDFSLLNQYSEFCLGLNHSYCIALESTFTEFLAQYRSLIIVILILLTSFVFINASVTLYLLKRFYSINSIVKRSIKKDKFFSLYQPIIELKTGQIVGCEALARYNGGDAELYPDQFIPVVRKLNLSWLFTEQIIRKAILDLESHSDLPDGFRVGFNLFPCDISTGRIQQILDIDEVRNTRFNIVFEVTEDEELDANEAREQLTWLNDQGFKIAVDDFGTGYSSLNQIKNMNCQILKIDRSFVMDMEEGSIKSSLIPHIIKIASDLNLQVVAEGIENVMQEKELRELGVEFGQGWGLGKPMEAKNIVNLYLSKR